MKRWLLASMLSVAGGPDGALASEPAAAPGSVVALKARPLPLSSVRVTGGPLKTAQDLDARYLLELEPDRMLAYLRQRAGLPARDEPYGGWDGAGRQLTGHIAGHYLSAVSLMWAATGDARFKERAEVIVRELSEVQQKHGDGYIGAQLDRENVSGKLRLEELAKGIIRSTGFDLNGLWSPWYVEHKIFAGLRDAYRHTGNPLALEVEAKFAGWVEGVLGPLTDAQVQQMLGTEFGGMNEVLVDLYVDTGDRRWLALSDKFQHHAIIDPLAAGTDILGSKHGNTLVPKLYGSLARYVHAGSEKDGKAARFFWQRVALHHSFATGGHGKNEYFGVPDQLNEMVDGRTAETCNIYNMLKLTRALFALEPDVRYAEFHERALFNHILASIDPQDGRTCYMVPVGRSVQREYQNMSESFTCCVGSGMESHALHGDGIYYESGDRLWVNLYVPSTADWQAAGAKLEMTTGFPQTEAASLKLTLRSPRKLTLALRRPAWAGEGFRARVNAAPVRSLPRPGAYLELTRTWKSGDVVELVLPKALRLEPLPDNPRRVALMWGPLALAGDVGPEVPRGRRGQGAGSEQPPAPPAAPVLIAAEQPVEKWLKPVAGKPGSFRTAGVGRDRDVDFMPFHQLHRRRYGIYWDLFTPQEWERKLAADAAEREKRKKLEAATLVFVQPGQEAAERDFNPLGEDSTAVQVQGRSGRRGSKWFSFDLPVDPARPMSLLVTYTNDEQQRRSFDVLVEGRKLGEQVIERRSPEKDVRFFDVEYAIPADLPQGRSKLTVRFEATGGNGIGTVLGLRMVRADAPR
jgi:DUF1680 family protein